LLNADLPTFNGVLCAKKWTAADYDITVNNPIKSGLCGFKHKCSFNKLQSFHDVGQLKVGARAAHEALLYLDLKGDITSVSNKEIMASLTPVKRVNASKYRLVSVIGKNNKKNYLLFDPVMRRAVDVIIAYRTVGGISISNRMVFAIPNTTNSFLRHSLPMKKLAMLIQ
jgi:hypothetical protein